MAIKGKRKSQKKARSTAAARPRPVGGARPVAPRGKRVPFYRTFQGQLTTIVIALVLVGVAMWFFSDRSSDSKRLAERQDALAAYTSEVRGHLQDTNQAIREMAGAPFNTNDESQLEGLEELSKSWVDSFQAAGALAAALTGPDSLQPATRVLVQSFQAYTSAARTYALVPKAEGSLRQDLLDRAGETRAAANELVAAALQILDQERSEADMDGSGIAAPSTLPPVVPTPAATEEDAAKGNKKKGGKGDG